MNRDAVITREFPPVLERYTAKETILYALGIGVGVKDSLDRDELPFLNSKALRIVPSQAAVLCFPGPWLSFPELGIDYSMVLHGGQGITFERPLQPEATIRGEYEVLGIDDKGADKGAVVYFEKRLLDDADGGVICRARATYFLRADGGCGSWGTPEVAAPPVPDRAPDRTVELPTSKRQALIYQLNGDYNPLHVDPDSATRSGFPRPILHGLSSFGTACFGFVQSVCGGDPDKLGEFVTRFSRPVFPGETLRLELFDEGDVWRFRARVIERNEVVLDRGLARLR